MTVKLEYPFTINGVEVDQIDVRRPTANDLLAAERGGGNEQDKVFRLLTNICEVSPEDLGLMDLADYRRLAETITGFLSPARTSVKL